MNSLAVALMGCGALYLGYLCYGRVIARLWDLQPDRKTPAVESPDGADYVPAKHWTVLFGHHFASIAGAGPILGPVWACAVWGWLPALIWIVVGAIFLGAVHDLSALMASLRARGKSIAEIAEANLGRRVRLVFGAFLWLALVLVVAVFANVAAQGLAAEPRMVIPTFGLIPLAIVVGLMMYRWRVPHWIATLAGLAALSALLIAGYYLPVVLPWGERNALAWTIALLAYAYSASVAPVNLLLQPRDHLSAFVLYLGVAAGAVGLLLTRPALQTPPIIAFSGSKGPLWPMLFVTIACGAISGFHSLVASGTSSKQLASEGQATRIAYGGMVAEAGVAVLTVIAVSAGLRWGKGADSFAAVLQARGPLVAYASGFSTITKPLLGSVGVLVALTLLNTFVLTTLDTATRIARYIGEELFAEGLGMRPLRNPFLSTLIIIALSFYLALGPSQTLWLVFGSANQLIAALALLVLTVVLWHGGKPTLYTLLPFLFMLATTVAALLYQGRGFVAQRQVALGAICLALILLALMMVLDSLRASLCQRRADRPPLDLARGDPEAPEGPPPPEPTGLWTG